jgi:hypothetical protein
MQHHWQRALGNLHADLAHDIVRAFPITPQLDLSQTMLSDRHAVFHVCMHLRMRGSMYLQTRPFPNACARERSACFASSACFA